MIYTEALMVEGQNYQPKKFFGWKINHSSQQRRDYLMITEEQRCNVNYEEIMAIVYGRVTAEENITGVKITWLSELFSTLKH